MTENNPAPDTRKIATISVFEKRIFANKKSGYVIYFVAEDGEVYRKFVSTNLPHWKKMFFNMGQTVPDFLKVEPLIGNKVELVIGPDNHAKYVNRLTAQQLADLSITVGFIGEVKQVAPENKEQLACWDKIKKFFNE